MYDDLLNQLSDRGLNWAPGGLESHDWSKSEEIGSWVLEICASIHDEFDPEESGKFPKMDPRALILLSQACVLLLGKNDGVVSKDMATIAYLNITQSDPIDPEIEFICRGLISRGRYIDCVIYFQKKLLDEQYDDSFVPDIAEVINDGNWLMEHLLDGDLKWDDENTNGRIRGNQAMMLATIVRGAFMQLELGLRVMTPLQVNEFLQIIGPLAATANLNYAKLASKERPLHYSVCHSMFAYTAFVFKNLGAASIPIESILDSVNKSCLDNSEISGVERYYTLFTQLLRLRILSVLGPEGPMWEDAVFNARKALSESSNLNSYAAYSKIINQITDGEFVIDLQYYAEQLFAVY